MFHQTSGVALVNDVDIGDEGMDTYGENLGVEYTPQTDERTGSACIEINFKALSFQTK